MLSGARLHSTKGRVATFNNLDTSWNLQNKVEKADFAMEMIVNYGVYISIF